MKVKVISTYTSISSWVYRLEDLDIYPGLKILKLEVTVDFLYE